MSFRCFLVEIERHGLTATAIFAALVWTLYQVGARMLASYPVVPLLEEMGIGIGVMSYNGSVFWGVTSDQDVVPDVGEFTRALVRSLAGVEKAASAPAKAAPRKPR